MRVLETRHVSAEVRLMTWSPKMDLIATATSKPDVNLHRLTWQKVWTFSNKAGNKRDMKDGDPTSLTFHPEGLYLAIGFKNSCTLVEVETGSIVTTHEVEDLSCVAWKPTVYVPSLKDLFSVETQRLESCLSVLLLGTKSGHVRIYTGAGLLYTVTLSLNSPYPTQILEIELPKDFTAIQVLTSISYESDSGNVLSVYHFDTSEYATHGEVLGVFAVKAASYQRYLKLIDTDLIGLHENWGKIFEVYRFYMTYGTGNFSDSIIADYMEILMSGNCAVEVEMFLGSAGRDKEAKKYITALQTAADSFNDNLRGIKMNVTLLLRELADLRGYHKYFCITHGQSQENSTQGIKMKDTQLTDGMKIISSIEKLISLLYHGMIHVQHIANRFLRSFFHFITLVINTIQTLSASEAPLDETMDPERIFELLRFKASRNIFEMIQINPEDSKPTAPNDENSDPVKKSPEDKLAFLDQCIPRLSESQYRRFCSVTRIIDITKGTPEEDIQWPSFWTFLKENGLSIQPDLLGKPNEELTEMLNRFTPLAEEYFQKLSQEPMLDNKIPQRNLVLNCFEDAGLETDRFGILEDPESSSTLVYHHQGSGNQGSRRVWLYRLDSLETKDPTVTASLFTFSQNVQASEFFNMKYLSVLCYSAPDQPARTRHDDEDDDGYRPADTAGQSILTLIDIEGVLEDLPSRPLRIPETLTVLENKWTEVVVNVPMEASVSGPIEHDQISHVLPLGSFHPIMMALSGARRVGALLDLTKREVQLLDMDLELTENSCDLDTTGNSSITAD